MKEEKDQGFFPQFGQNRFFIQGVHNGIDQMGKQLTQNNINKTFVDGFNLWKQENQFQYRNMFNSHEQYVIVSVADKQMALDMPVNSNRLVLWEKHGENFQKWKIIFNSGHYAIENADKQLLTIEHNSPENGATVTAHHQNNSAGEVWDFVPANEENNFFIRTFCGKCLEASSNENKTPIRQANFEGKPNQQWIVIPKLNTNTHGHDNR